jgi:glycosyltransferase involved in cell wall biosynthesis
VTGRQRPVSVNTVPRVSFVIPAHDEEDQLPRTLDAIASAARTLGLDYEMIVANDGSTDRTEEVARERGAAVVSHARRQIAATRNLGARAAKGDIFIFVDADTAVNAGSVGEAMGALAAGAAGGGGPVRIDGRVPLLARMIMPPLNLAFRVVGLAGGCFIFCTREAFEASGGWDETLYASEEIIMSRAIKRSGRFVFVRTPVLTSGRKLRTHSGWLFLRLAWDAARTRGRVTRGREGLEMWYGPRVRERPPEEG